VAEAVNLGGPACRVSGVEREMVLLAANDGVDPVCKFCHRGKGIRIEARATASPDEGVNALDQSIADQRATRVPLLRQTRSKAGF
jgi:hypothetical protein